MDGLCAARNRDPSGERFREPLGRWRAHLGHAAAGCIERAAGLCGAELRDRIPGAQIALASDAAGALYALWNAGAANGGPERIYFSSSTTGGASWSERVNVSRPRRRGALLSRRSLRARRAMFASRGWMRGRPRRASQSSAMEHFYRSSTNGGATWSAETQTLRARRGYDYILPRDSAFRSATTSASRSTVMARLTRCGAKGGDYKSPGSIWYARGR